MTVVNLSPEKTFTRKTPSLKVFQLFETDRDNYGSSSSDDTENCSPKSVVSKLRKKDVTGDVFSRRVRNQIERIRAEDSHLGEDIGECLIARVCYAGHDLVDDVMMFTRPASPLSGKVEGRIDMVQ